jgi:hypothetical protein
MIEVVRPPSTICNGKPGRAGATTGSANTLGIIKWFWRNVSQKNGIKIAKVDSQFEGSGATQHVNSTLLEFALNLPAALSSQLCRVLLNNKPLAKVSSIKSPIMVLCEHLVHDRNKTTVASAPGANVLEGDPFDSIACVAPVHPVLI